MGGKLDCGGRGREMKCCASYWWCDPSSGTKYADVGTVADAQTYYDNMAGDYEAVVRGWGYNCPEVGVPSPPASPLLGRRSWPTR